MRRQIEISTDVFASIWANRQEGEESENDILHRILNDISGKGPSLPSNEEAGGVHDTRNGVYFKEGFEVFRNYKGKQYRAVANAGVWRRADTNETYPSLSALNQSIVSGNENIWNGNWKYHADDGKSHSINMLRES